VEEERGSPLSPRGRRGATHGFFPGNDCLASVVEASLLIDFGIEFRSLAGRASCVVVKHVTMPDFTTYIGCFLTTKEDHIDPLLFVDVYKEKKLRS
jgi:hypothetical protein